MPNEFASTTNAGSGLLKNYYDDGKTSVLSEALKRKRNKSRLDKLGDVGISDDLGKLPDSLDTSDD